MLTIKLRRKMKLYAKKEKAQQVSRLGFLDTDSVFRLILIVATALTPDSNNQGGC